uniref:Transmembrane protein n=1 Tax=Salix viminalis TaxID=40686 RepID=A0A6N2KBZ7_SALVM
MEKKGGFSVTVPAGEEGASSAFLYDGILSLIWSSFFICWQSFLDLVEVTLLFLCRFKRFLRDSFSRRRRSVTLLFLCRFKRFLRDSFSRRRRGVFSFFICWHSFLDLVEVQEVSP